MELNNTVVTVIFVVVGIILLAANVYVGKRRTEKTLLGMVTTITLDVKHNLLLVRNFSFHRKSKKFKTRNWMKNNGKINFLPIELLTELSHVFDMAEDINLRIDSAKKFKSDSYMSGIDVSKLEAPLAQCIPPLQEWLQDNVNNPEFAPKRRGMFR